MISRWRTRMETRCRKSEEEPAVRSRPAALSGAEIVIPAGFRCPISLDLMKDPVTLCTGITYDRQSIETWLDAGNATCPVTNQTLQIPDLIPNHVLRRMIQSWCVENRAAGIERIPTPRIPATRSQVSEILSQIEAASFSGCFLSITAGAETIRRIAKESERNRRCVIGSAAGASLAATFSIVCDRLEDSDSDPEHAPAVESILAAITAVAPLDAEAQSHLWRRACVRRLARVLRGGSLEGRGNAASVLGNVLRDEEKLLGSDGRGILESTPELVEGLVRVVREPICPSATKASLAAILRMVSASELISRRFVQSDVVHLLLEILPDCERSVCEKALALLDQAFASKEGRERAYAHALSVPVVVKKMLRVSDTATELAVSVLWRLCRAAGDEGVLMEALSVGAFQKLLVLLQLGCREGIKTKTTDLLRMMRPYKDRMECVDSWDFKNLKRPS